MLLPKRVEKKMKKYMSDDEITKRILKGYVDIQKTKDSYLLDEKNAIILIENNDKTVHNETYIMIHERLIERKLKEINRWYVNSYYFDCIHDETPIRDLILFKIQNDSGRFNALYDYQNGKLIVPKDDCDLLAFGRKKKLTRTI